MKVSKQFQCKFDTFFAKGLKVVNAEIIMLKIKLICLKKILLFLLSLSEAEIFVLGLRLSLMIHKLSRWFWRWFILQGKCHNWRIKNRIPRLKNWKVWPGLDIVFRPWTSTLCRISNTKIPSSELVKNVHSKRNRHIKK